VSEYGVMRLTRAYASAMGDLKYMVLLVSIDIHNQSSLEHKVLQYKKNRTYTVFETGRAGPALTSSGPALRLLKKPGRPPLARALEAEARPAAGSPRAEL
jgi:hypothetical protein